MPGRGERQADREEGPQARGAEVARGELEVAVDRRERRRGDPHREYQAVHRVHQDHAGHGPVQPELVEDARDVDVDREARKRLRQEEGEQDRGAPRQLQPRERVARRHCQRQARRYGRQRDPDAGHERDHGIAAAA